ITDASEIKGLALEPKHRFAASSVKRLHHDVAVLSPKRLDLGKIARNQGRGHQIGKLGDKYFIGSIADTRWIVNHQRLLMNALKQVYERDIRKIERRILAQK